MRRLTRLVAARRRCRGGPPGRAHPGEHPNNSLYTFTGNLDVPRATYDGPLSGKTAHPERKKKVSLVPHNVLLRGSSLRNTEYVFGLAVYAGHDTKVMMNASAAPSKRSQIELGMDRVVLLMLLLLLAMGTVTAIVCGVWIGDESRRAWYLQTDSADMVFNPGNAPKVGVVAFLTSYVLYGYLIPISLYVSLEFVKFMQATVFINLDRALYHAATDTPMRARTSNLNEELGMVHTVLSDKTGTLTCNSMEFFKMSIAGGSYGAGVTEIERAVAKRNGKPLPPSPTTDAATGAALPSGPIEPGFNFRDDRVENGAWMRLGEKETFRDFFRVLAVCHTVIPEGEPTPNTVCYQAESPDESAFVVAAKRFGFFFKARHTRRSKWTSRSSDASAAAPSVASETEVQDSEHPGVQLDAQAHERRRASRRARLFCTARAGQRRVRAAEDVAAGRRTPRRRRRTWTTTRRAVCARCVSPSARSRNRSTRRGTRRTRKRRRAWRSGTRKSRRAPRLSRKSWSCSAPPPSRTNCRTAFRGASSSSCARESRFGF